MCPVFGFFRRPPRLPHAILASGLVCAGFCACCGSSAQSEALNPDAAESVRQCLIAALRAIVNLAGASAFLSAVCLLPLLPLRSSASAEVLTRANIVVAVSPANRLRPSLEEPGVDAADVALL